MIVCTKCGHKNGNDDAFCQNPSCGAFLEWEGKPAPTGMLPKASGGTGPAGTTPPPGGAGQGSGRSGSQEPGGPPRRQATPPTGAHGGPPPGPSSGTAGGPPSGPPATGAARDPVELTQAFDAAAEAKRPDGARPPTRPDARRADQAARMLIRPGEGAREARRPEGQPEAQPPQEVQRPVDHGQAPAHGPTVEPGQTPCQNCGWGNDPGRHFCRHCGASLDVAAPKTQLVERVAPRPADGDRTLRMVLAALGAVAVLGAAVLLGLSLFRGGAGSGNDGGGGTGGTGGGGTGVTRAGGGDLAAVPADAVRAAASSQSGEHVAANLVDGALGTFWSRTVNDRIAKVTFTFGQPQRLARISIAAGASGDQFGLRHRPKVVRLDFSDGASKSVTLADRPGYQNVDLEPRAVDQVRISILEVYEATGGGATRRLTSISEVRFFAGT